MVSAFNTAVIPFSKIRVSRSRLAQEQRGQAQGDAGDPQQWPEASADH